MPVPVFCCFCISEKLYRKYSRNCTGQKPSVIFFRNEDEARRGATEDQPGGHTRPRRGQPRVGPLGRLRLRHFAHIFSASGKPSTPEKKSTKEFRSRRHRRTHLGRVLQLFPAPCRRENPSPEASTPPCLPPRRCVSSPPRDYGSIAVARW